MEDAAPTSVLSEHYRSTYQGAVLALGSPETYHNPLRPFEGVMPGLTALSDAISQYVARTLVEEYSELVQGSEESSPLPPS